jgi:glycosyltransferase involved in cell wall biosynthesis
MPKIVLAATTDLAYDQRMLRIASSLAKRYDVLLVGKIGPQPLHEERPFEQKRLRCFFSKGFLFYAEFNIRLFFFLLRRKFDAVSAADLDTILPCIFVAKIKNKPCAYDAHEYFTELPELFDRPFVKGIWKKIEAFAVPRTHLRYTVSNGLAKLFQREHAKKFCLVRNMPLRTPANGIAKISPPIILYQGALNQGRGLEQAIEAMALLPQNAQLWLAGEGDLSVPLRNLAQRLDLSEKVKFWGKILPADLKNLTPSATIGLNLLENKGLNYYYSLANKFFDYIQAGVPCVCTDFPEYRLLNEQFQTAVLIQELAAQPLAAAISNLLNDATFYENLQANCDKAANEWHWQKEEEKLLTLYEDMLQNWLTKKQN